MRALVVDDEPYTREGIVESVDWKAYGIEEVMDADNGQTAMEICGWFCPDIIISDVQMPQMDGITFARRFLEKFPESKIIFISAYLEIQYYKQALKLSAVDYVEKPLDMEELEAAIQKASDAIGANEQKKENLKNSMILSEERLTNYLIASGKNRTDISGLCGQLGFPETGEYICLCFRDLEREDDRQSVMTALHDFFSEQKIKCITAPLEQYRYCVILALKNRGRYQMGGLCRDFLNLYPSFQVGIGFYVEHTQGISESWKMAKEVINQAFYDPGNAVFEMTALPKQVQEVKSGTYIQVNETINKEPEKLPVLLDIIFAEFEEKKSLHPSSVKAFARAVMADLMRIGEELPDKGKLFAGVDPMEYLDYCESLSEIYDALRDIAQKMVDKSVGETGMSPVIKTAHKYIRKHCSEQNLSMVDIAEACGISVGYLCNIFKQETGTTTRQYIEDYRLALAKEKLAGTGDRIADIAQECGFLQPGYFSRVFKQKVGMTPAEYRERNRMG